MVSDFEHWEQLQQLFHLAEASPEADLDALLNAACADPEMRSRARRLIEAARSGMDTDSKPQLFPVMRRIGPYTIIRLLGTGGIGRVYLGERLVGGAVQRVAVKVLLRSAAGPGFTERFAREQHILASLSHANITRMLDAGIADGGEPYLVMEYVDGEHLDTWCDEKKLGIDERLRLFLQVCEAVAYAHRNLVVHLDLKPSNVLIAREDGTVKLLDFGTSKVVQPDSLLTTTVMATPAYASPEQLLNEPVTTVCDVYALGAILFELLAGRRPNRDSSVALLIERSMKEAAPESLRDAVTEDAAECRALTQTRLRGELDGDLETIVTKCLAPRPKDRYATVDALMIDVQQYLNGRPIFARPQTTTYRIGKFVRRNRGAVLASTLALLALVALGGYAAWRQQQAYREGQRALQMQTFLYRLMKLANSNYLGKPAASVPEFLELGVKVLPQFIADAADQRVAELALAESMHDNGDSVHAGPVFDKIIRDAKAAGDISAEAEAEAFASDIAYGKGDTSSAEALSTQALSLAHRREVSPSTRVRIEIFAAAGRENSGRRTDDNLRLLRVAAAESQQAHLPVQEQAFALGQLAGFLEQRGMMAEAEPILQKVVTLFGSEPYALCDQAETYGDLAFVRGVRGDAPGSVALFRRAYDGLVACSGPSTRSTLMMQAHLASAMLKNKQASQVVSMLEESLPAWERLSGNTPDLANPLIFLARAYLANKDYAKAEAMAARTVSVQGGKIPQRSYRMGVSELVWAQALAAQGRDADALPHARLAVEGLSASPALTQGQKATVTSATELLSALKKKA